MSEARTVAAPEYAVRLLTPADRAGYLALHETVFGAASDEWFDWKFVDNPYFDHVPVVVALDGDQVIGAKSGVGFEVARDGLRYRALQPGDTMVHPDHRRRGVYSLMTEFMKEAYTDGPAALFFNYPNYATLPGSLKHGWREVGTVTTRYRINNPVRFLGVDAGPATDAAAAVANAATTGALRCTQAVLSPAADPDRLTVRRHATVPTETLADLYRRAVPAQLHVVRDERYLGWRFDNPEWTYTAYTVERAGRPVLGAVVGRERAGGFSRVAFTEVLPLRSPDLHARAGEQARVDAECALLDRVVSDYGDADVLTAAEGSLSASALTSFGFLPDTRSPLSRVASPSTLVVYPLTPELDRVGIDDLDDWVLGLGDRDTN